MTIRDVDVGERYGAAHHVEARVPEDPLEREDVATVDEIAMGERVAELCGLHRAPTPARRLRRSRSCWIPEVDPLAEDQAALETSRQWILATADRVVP